jgi:hypothetical protein
MSAGVAFALPWTSGAVMAPFPILFFIFVEMPSMAAMLVHKGIMNATGRQTRPLNVWLYRLLGVAGLALLVGMSLTIGGNAACLLLVLVIGGGLGLLLARRKQAEAAQGIGPQALPGVLADLSRRSLGDLRRTHGRPPNPAEADIHRRAADLMAALRFYQVAVDPRFTDWQIGNQLAVNAPRMMEQMIDAYGRLPPSPERDVAAQILRTYLPQGLAVTGNAYTLFAGGALRGDRPGSR